ncbi:MAG: toxin-activating lysine-acyltransferase [Parvularculaceae bacterium]
MQERTQALPDEVVRTLRAVRDRNAFAALGRAVSYLMTKPSFAERQFGNWSRTLTGQVNRGHYFLVTDGKNIVGFVGWAMVDEKHAALWLEGRGDLSSRDCIGGDCMVINAWAAEDEAVNRFILRELRKHAVGCKAAFAKRFYEDGSVRPMRIAITPALARHVETRC